MTFPQVNATPEVNLSEEKQCLSGLHILANFSVPESYRVMNCNSFKSFMDLLIDEFKLTKFGEIYQDFEPGGFAAVMCLANSHLSIQTKPELNLVTFDVYVSNRSQGNHATVHALYHSVKHFFNATVTFEQFILR